MPATAKQSNATTTTTQAKPQADILANQAAVWHAIAKTAKKEAESRRDDLPPGFAAQVDLHIAAKIGDYRLADDLAVQLSVGHDSPRAGNGPSGADVLAWVLSKVNRPDVIGKILGDLVSDYAKGDLPTDSAIAAQVEATMKVVRQTRSTVARGNVSAQVSRPETSRLNVYG